jgi:uncharacterized protein
MDYFEEVLESAKQIINSSRKSQDWEHTQRVYNLCMHIGIKENADIEILKLASVLHDIGREKQDESKGEICLAEVGAAMAKELLEKFNYSPQVIDKVVHCIETHRFRNNKIPESLEAKVLYDADKLDAIGAIGIGRAFVFAGEIGAGVHNKYIDIEKTKSYTEDDTAYREFLVKLCRIKDCLLTQEGIRIAQGRHNFMVEFFDRLNKEVDGEL